MRADSTTSILIASFRADLLEISEIMNILEGNLDWYLSAGVRF